MRRFCCCWRRERDSCRPCRDVVAYPGLGLRHKRHAATSTIGDAHRPRRQFDIYCAPTLHLHIGRGCSDGRGPCKTIIAALPTRDHPRAHLLHSKQDSWPPAAFPRQTQTLPDWPRTPEGTSSRSYHAHSTCIGATHSLWSPTDTPNPCYCYRPTLATATAQPLLLLPPMSHVCSS